MTKPDQQSLSWASSPDQFRGEIAATVALGRDRWEALGARFVQTDDRQGEHPYLASGSVIGSAGTPDFGVLDYGADSTYLLVPGSEATRPVAAAALITALTQHGVLGDGEVLEMVSNSTDRSLAARLERLEGVVEELSGARAEERGELAEGLRPGGTFISFVSHEAPDMAAMYEVDDTEIRQYFGPPGSAEGESRTFEGYQQGHDLEKFIQKGDNVIFVSVRPAAPQAKRPNRGKR